MRNFPTTPITAQQVLFPQQSSGGGAQAVPQPGPQQQPWGGGSQQQYPYSQPAQQAFPQAGQPFLQPGQQSHPQAGFPQAGFQKAQAPPQAQAPLSPQQHAVGELRHVQVAVKGSLSSELQPPATSSLLQASSAASLLSDLGERKFFLCSADHSSHAVQMVRDALSLRPPPPLFFECASFFFYAAWCCRLYLHAPQCYPAPPAFS